MGQNLTVLVIKKEVGAIWHRPPVYMSVYSFVGKIVTG